MLEQPRTRLFPWIAAALLVLAVGYRFLGEPPARAAARLRQRAGGRARSRPRSSRPAAASTCTSPVPSGGPGSTAYVTARASRLRSGLPAARRAKAELTGTNLAARVQDGQQIVVPLRGAAPVAAAAAPGGAPAGPLSLASATQAQLEELDGIGPTLAARIIEYRDANGGFRSVEELGEVDGIGEVRLEALREAVQP